MEQKLLLAALSDLKLAVENIEVIITAENEKPAKQDRPAEKKAITLEQVRAKLAEKSQAGFSEEIKALIKACGADKLTDVDPKHYESLIAAAEAM